MTRDQPENTVFDIVPGAARSAMERAQGCITAEDLKTHLQDLALAAAGCMKAKPSKDQRTRLRLTLGRALKALKSPIKGERADERGNSSSPTGGSSPINKNAKPQTDPVALIADYVNGGGNWTALIAAITTRGRSGQTKILYPISKTPTKGKNHDNRENPHPRSH